MLFKKDILQRIGSGEVTLAFRRWRKPTVKQGGSLRTGVGVLKITSITKVSLRSITDADAALAGFDSARELRAQLQVAKDGEIYRIAFELAGADPRVALRDDDSLTDAELSDLRAKLEALDRRSLSGRWVARVLRSIGEKEGRTAGELADLLQLEKATVKVRIRKLKELGLTESLASGYRLSKRGRRVASVSLGKL